MFVLDASVAVSWCLNDEQNEYALQVLAAMPSDEASVPAIWPAELSNALLMAERRHRTTPELIALSLAKIREFPIVVQPSYALAQLGALVDVARENRLSVYDAVYLQLAFTQGLPLATVDGPLRHSATAAGIKIYMQEGT